MRWAGPDWQRVETALERLAETSGAPVPFWLRDDDAVAESEALDRLFEIASATGIPVTLAVIPAHAESSLAEVLTAWPGTAVFQHGYAHENHAPEGEKKREAGADRALDLVRAEIGEGARRLADFPGLLPVFVPPWNRIAADVAAELPALGFSALSAYGDRPAPEAAPGLAVLNAHLDPVAWHAGRGFVGEAAFLDALACRIERLLDGRADLAEATGLLTHHLVHDEETFAFVGELLQFLATGGLTQWCSGAMLLEDLGPRAVPGGARPRGRRGEG